MKIAVDINMTILTCDSLIYKIANNYFPGHCKSTSTYTTVKDNNITREKLINKISKAHNYRCYRTLENSTEILSKWIKEGNHITLLSTGSANDEIKSCLLRCIKKFGICFSDIVLKCTNKAIYCNDNGIEIMIDNSPFICKKCKEKNITSICYIPNKKRADKLKKEGLLVATSWDEIERMVKKIITNKNR